MIASYERFTRASSRGGHGGGGAGGPSYGVVLLESAELETDGVPAISSHLGGAQGLSPGNAGLQGASERVFMLASEPR